MRWELRAFVASALWVSFATGIGSALNTMCTTNSRFGPHAQIHSGHCGSSMHPWSYSSACQMGTMSTNWCLTNWRSGWRNGEMIGRRSLSFGSGRSPVAMHGDLVHSAILGWSHPDVAATLLKQHTDTVWNAEHSPKTLDLPACRKIVVQWVPCAGLFRQKAEEGRTLDALPLLRCEALKKARPLWSLVWRVLVRCARGAVPTAVEHQEKACAGSRLQRRLRKETMLEQPR